MEMNETSKEAVYDEIMGILKKLSGDWEYYEEITPRTFFAADLGFESIDLVVLATNIEKQYQKQFPFAQFFAEVGQRDVRDVQVGELVDFVFANLNSTLPSS
jgi:acyl carrier protein